MSEDVRAARLELAVAHRWGAKLGFNEGVNGGHFSLMVPGRDDRFLLIPNGIHWAEATPDNLIAVDFEGNTVQGRGEAERSAVFIHSGVHRLRPDARCILHSHCPHATALSMLENGKLGQYGQQALRFYGRVAYYDEFNALAHDGSEGERMARALGKKTVLFLANHGVIVVGPTVADAFDDLYYLERACQNQVTAMAAGQPLRPIPKEMAARAVQQYAGQRENCRLHFESLKRMLAREDPAFAAALSAPLPVSRAAPG